MLPDTVQAFIDAKTAACTTEAMSAPTCHTSGSTTRTEWLPRHNSKARSGSSGSPTASSSRSRCSSVR